MHAPSTDPAARAPINGQATSITAAEVAAFHERLLGGPVTGSSAEQIELLAALENLKSAVTATQATVVLAVEEAAREEDARAGIPARRRAKDVPVRLGLALRQSPARARSFLGAARIWHGEMPHTFAALRSGRLTEYRATILVRETAHLQLPDRQSVDAQLCADPRVLEGLGNAAVAARARRAADTLDPASATERARRAENERTVSVRPAPDTMAYVTALLPVAQGVGVYAALRHAADSAQATGDARSRGQLMADVFVERLTGQASAVAVPLTINLLVSDATLLGAGHEPGLVLDEAGRAAGTAGTVPAQVARNLAAHALDADAAWVRRLYTPDTGQVVAMSSTRRFFADGLAGLLRLRDQGLCRTPYCDAPIRHLDHIVPAARGGPTTAANGQGLCEACNQAKTSSRISQRPNDDATGRHAVTTTTSTGHRYRSTAPPLPRPADAGGTRLRGLGVTADVPAGDLGAHAHPARTGTGAHKVDGARVAGDLRSHTDAPADAGTRSRSRAHPRTDRQPHDHQKPDDGAHPRPGDQPAHAVTHPDPGVSRWLEVPVGRPPKRAAPSRIAEAGTAKPSTRRASTNRGTTRAAAYNNARQMRRVPAGRGPTGAPAGTGSPVERLFESGRLDGHTSGTSW